MPGKIKNEKSPHDDIFRRDHFNKYYHVDFDFYLQRIKKRS